jgi:hypothetical protein
MTTAIRYAARRAVLLLLLSFNVYGTVPPAPLAEPDRLFGPCTYLRRRIPLQNQTQKKEFQNR